MRFSGELALLSTAALAVAAAAWWAFRKKASPEERERARRLEVNSKGRMGDANITDVSDGTLYYTYRVRGVEYIASQDISALHDRLPRDPSVLIGPVTLKYLPANPVESIVVCEDWSGFRTKESSNQ